MLMAYLPKEKILIQRGSLFTAGAGRGAAGADRSQHRTLYQNIVKLKLDVAQHVPTHGRIGTNDEFMKIFAKTATTN